MQETWFQSLGWEDLLEEDIATHSSIHAWRMLEARFAYYDSRAITHSPSPHSRRPDVPSTHERLSELPVVPREKSDTGATAGENQRDAPVIAR